MKIIATLKEIKDNENRVGLTPKNTRILTAKGHKVIVQTNAGIGSGFKDQEYIDSGAEIKDSASEIVQEADILIKVKEPIPSEYHLLDLFQGKTLFTYLHLSGVDPVLTDKLLENKITGIAYETVLDENGGTPLLSPMSSVAGVLAIQYGAEYLQKKYGGVGTTLGQIPGANDPSVVVFGAGIVGFTAAKTAVKLGSRVIVFDVNDAVIERVRKTAQEIFTSEEQARFEIVKSEPGRVNEELKKADLLIGAVLVAGARAPIVVSEEQIKSMKKGAVVIDVAIDQGGCIWGSKVTTHSDPIFDIEGKIFCCVANMPGQVAKQSTEALSATTFPFLEKMANSGVVETLRADKLFKAGLNTFDGKITCSSVAKDLDRMNDYVSFE